VDLVDQCIPHFNVAHAGHVIVDVQLSFLQPVECQAQKGSHAHSEHRDLWAGGEAAYRRPHGAIGPLNELYLAELHERLLHDLGGKIFAFRCPVYRQMFFGLFGINTAASACATRPEFAILARIVIG